MNANRSSSAREWWIIAVMTVVGAILRFWRFGGLSLTHFDEGIYAFAGLWSRSDRGLFALDPMVIPYAPPGYPLLVRLSYMLLGVSDYSALLVSVACGIATIPVLGWLGRRTFGPGAGAAAATFAALSLAHVAFSRKALTDAPFLLAWLVALGLGGRFLEKPGLATAVVLGLAVGVAQNVKYNGGLAGVIVIVAALTGALSHREERRPGPMLRTFGWGLVSALTAIAIDLPWYRFVEDHGGYSALLRHQRSYSGGISSWRPHWHTQLGEAFALSGEPWVNAVTWLVAGLAFLMAGWAVPAARRFPRPNASVLLAGLGLGCAAAFLPAYLPWWIGLVWSLALLVTDRPAMRMLGASWIVMAVLTPFYHPYARLWLPLHAAGWLLLAGVFGQIGAFGNTGLEAATAPEWSIRRRQRLFLSGAAIACVVPATIQFAAAHPQPIRWSWVLEPSPATLRNFAFVTVPATIPGDGTTIRIFARRPLAFYLAQLRYTVQLEPAVEDLWRPGKPDTWEILDNANLSDESATQAWNLPPRNPRIAFTVEIDPVTELDVAPRSAFFWPGARPSRNSVYLLAPASSP